MKQVLFLKSAPAFPVQGADISMFERMVLLREHGWRGMLISTGLLAHQDGFKAVLENLGLPFSYDAGTQQFRYEHAGIECRLCLGEHADQFVTHDLGAVTPLFDAVLKEVRPDFLFGNLRDPIVLEYVPSTSTPHLMFLTEDEYPKPREPKHQVFARGLQKVQNIAVASQYLAQSIHRHYSREAEIFTNAVATSRYKLSKASPGEFITLLHPYGHKGVDLFLQLAKELPDKKFLVMAGTGAEYRSRKAALLSLPNLVLAQFTPRITEIYRQSRIVLVPSRWQEAFSRVIIEALCAETPVIASGTGGMRDAGGEAACYVPIEEDPGVPGGFKTERWIEEIKRLEDPVIYAESRERARKRIAQFEVQLSESMERLASFMENRAY